MSTTLFEAPEYNPEKERRKHRRIAAIVLIVAAVAGFLYAYRNWPEERVVNRFFDALQKQDYETAYAIWIADPTWKQHPDHPKNPNYSYHDFYLDWGPGGDYGIIRNHKIDGSANPRGSSGVLVQVTVNDRVQKARLWVSKANKSISYWPY